MCVTIGCFVTAQHLVMKRWCFFSVSVQLKPSKSETQWNRENINSLVGFVHLIHIFFHKAMSCAQNLFSTIAQSKYPSFRSNHRHLSIPSLYLCTHWSPFWVHQTSSIHSWHSPFTYTWLHSLPFWTITSSQTSLNILTSSRLLPLKAIPSRRIYSVMVMLKLWSLNHMNQSHLETCSKCRLLCPPQAC